MTDKRNKAFFLKSHNSAFQFGENESSGKKSGVKTLIHAAAIVADFETNKRKMD